MLPEVASGMIETRHIVTQVRSFCKKVKFFEASVQSIDLDNKQVILEHTIGRQSRYKQQHSSQPQQQQPPPPTSNLHEHTLKYDYLVIA